MNNQEPSVTVDGKNRIIIIMPNGEEYKIDALNSQVYPNTLCITLNHSENNMAIFPNVSNQVMIKSVYKHN